MKKFITSKVLVAAIAFAMLISLASVALADASYPNYVWGNRFDLQKNGVTNVQVGAFQRVLQQLNYAITVDWIFGDKTETAVKAFQGEPPAISKDGMVGKDTWNKFQSHLVWVRRDASGFDYYKVSGKTTAYWDDGPGGTWWLVKDDGTEALIK